MNSSWHLHSPALNLITCLGPPGGMRSLTAILLCWLLAVAVSADQLLLFPTFFAKLTPATNAAGKKINTAAKGFGTLILINK